MAIERNDLTETQEEETEEQRQERERREELAAIKASQQTEHEARIKAEAEAEAHRRILEIQGQRQTAPAPAVVTDAQWEEFEKNTGMTRQAAMANGEIMKQMISMAQAQTEEKFKALQDRTEKAEARLQEWEKKSGASAGLEDFYEKNPQYRSYKKEVSDFVAMFPDSAKSDPKELAKILDKAKTYVRGVVGSRGDTMRGDTRGSRGSQKFGERFADEGTGQEEEAELDLRGLNKVGARLVSDLNDNVKSRLADEETAGRYKKYATEDGMGVAVSMEEQFRQAEAELRRKRTGVFGGKNDGKNT